MLSINIHLSTQHSRLARCILSGLIKLNAHVHRLTVTAKWRHIICLLNLRILRLDLLLHFAIARISSPHCIMLDIIYVLIINPILSVLLSIIKSIISCKFELDKLCNGLIYVSKIWVLVSRNCAIIETLHNNDNNSIILFYGNGGQ